MRRYNNARHSSNRQARNLLCSGSGNQKAQIMAWIGLSMAWEKMDGLGLGNYSRVAEPRGAIEDDNGHCTIKTTKDRHARCLADA
jgi:hypothetical protein